MSYESSVSYGSKGSISTLGGQIRLDQGRGRLVIFDSGTGREINVIDRTGQQFSDSDERRIQMGAAPTDGRIGHWITKDGKDVIEELGG